MIELGAAARDLLPEMIAETGPDLTAAFATERPRLVRLCARLAGDVDAAEDLAQETLAEAWRARAKLRDAQGVSAWLTAIARHVCLRWRRGRGRELASPWGAGAGEAAEAAMAAEMPAEADELARALERGELAELLGRALALLPAETRALLIETYLRERPQLELAARRGLSVETLRARLHRGRLALRRVLTTDLRAEALAAGILPLEAARWQRTRIWCPFCGRHPLEAAIDRASGEYGYRCAGDCQPGSWLVSGARDAELVNELLSPKAILARHCLGSYARPSPGGRIAARSVAAGSRFGSRCRMAPAARPRRRSSCWGSMWSARPAGRWRTPAPGT